MRTPRKGGWKEGMKKRSMKAKEGRRPGKEGRNEKSIEEGRKRREKSRKPRK